MLMILKSYQIPATFINISAFLNWKKMPFLSWAQISQRLDKYSPLLKAESNLYTSNDALVGKSISRRHCALQILLISMEEIEAL